MNIIKIIIGLLLIAQTSFAVSGVDFGGLNHGGNKFRKDFDTLLSISCNAGVVRENSRHNWTVTDNGTSITKVSDKTSCLFNSTTDYLELPAAIDDTWVSFTLVVWAALSDVGIHHDALFSNRHADNEGAIHFEIDIRAGTGGSYNFFCDRSSDSGVYIPRTITPAEVAGKWMLLSAIWPNGASIDVVYQGLDLAVSGYNQPPSAYAPLSRTLQIGHRPNASYPYPFNGSLTGIRIFTRALSHTYLHRLYMAEKNGNKFRE